MIKKYQDVVNDIKTNVATVGISTKQLMGGNKFTDIPTDGGGVIKHYEFITFPKKKDGSRAEVRLIIMVKYDGSENEVEAWLRSDMPYDYAEPVADTRKKEAEHALLGRFVQLEAAGNVRIDPSALKTIVDKYLVFEIAGGLELVTTTIADKTITRLTTNNAPEAILPSAILDAEVAQHASVDALEGNE